MSSHPHRVAPPFRGFIRAIAALLGCIALPAGAAVRCVDTVGELDAARIEAIQAAEGTTWDIRIEQGSYPINGGLNFQFPGNADDKILILSGGWNDGCSSRTGSAESTELVALPPDGGEFLGSEIRFGGAMREVAVRHLTFRSFGNFSAVELGCAPYNICPDTDLWAFEYNRFLDGRYVLISSEDADRMVFRGNLVARLGLVAPVNLPVVLDYRNGEEPLVVSHNTFANLHCDGSVVAAVRIASERGNGRFHHNIFQSTGCGPDVEVGGAGSPNAQPMYPIANLYLSMTGKIAGNLADLGNVQSFNPKFVDAAGGNFRLANDSPAVNGGLNLAELIAFGIVLPPYDLDGEERLTGFHLDIGAYESPLDDLAPADLVVTTDADGGAGSLRAAIEAANQADGTPQRIVFDIPGACPRTILLQSELPPITDTLVIDGYTQPGASPNTFPLAFNADLCVVIAPGASGVSHALRVPDGEPADTTLTVQGLAFGTGFFSWTGPAISLRAGAGHGIYGNVFGGQGPGDLGSLGTLFTGVLVRGTATGVQIGGEEAALRNVFGSMTTSAIVITDAGTSGHTIRDNLIGLGADGVSPQPIALNGISSNGGPEVEIAGNVIAAAGTGIALFGAATQNYRIERNRLGVTAYGTAPAGTANGVGIRVAGGSGGHRIGATGTPKVGQWSNEIRNSLEAGVRIVGDAGPGTLVRGNRIVGHGSGGLGLAIDLDLLGPLANDPGDADGGGNGRQNTPLLLDARGTAQGREIDWSLATTPNTTLKLDFYRAADCPEAARGPALDTWLGSTDVITNAQGLASGTTLVAGLGQPGALTATATALPAGSTSEPAPCFLETSGGEGPDALFADGFED